MSARILECVDDKFIINEKEYLIEDIYSQEYYKFIEEKCLNFRFGSLYDNVLYLYYIMDLYAIVWLIKSNNIKKIILENSKYEDYIQDAIKLVEDEVVCIGKKRDRKQLSLTKTKIVVFAAGVYLAFEQLSIEYDSKILDTIQKDLCIIRDKASREKIKSQTDLIILFEDGVGKGSFYSTCKRNKRLKYAIKSIRKAWNLIDELNMNLKGQRITHINNRIINFFSMRFLAISLFEQVLDTLLENTSIRKFISGDNLDMYAMVEEVLTKKHGVPSICYPHGIEYGFKLPEGFTGGVFYSTSQYAAEYFNKMYKTDKFIYDFDTINSMYNKNITIPATKRVVYFSEPRDSKVNIEILEQLINGLKPYGIPLYIKHHPNDNLEEYIEFNNEISEINDLGEALTGNLCIARKSTILLESIYNHSKPLAILINEKDKTIYETFPSLMNDEIKKFFNIGDLVKCVIQEMN